MVYRSSSLWLNEIVISLKSPHGSYSGWSPFDLTSDEKTLARSDEHQSDIPPVKALFWATVAECPKSAHPGRRPNVFLVVGIPDVPEARGIPWFDPKRTIRASAEAFPSAWGWSQSELLRSETGRSAGYCVCWRFPPPFRPCRIWIGRMHRASALFLEPRATAVLTESLGLCGVTAS
jgi:hypothetical protein